MGPNLFSQREGAALDIQCDDDEGPALLLAWRTEVAVLAAGLGWEGPEIHARPYRGGGHAFLGAPIDALLTATEVNEQAFAIAEAIVEGRAVPDRRDVIARLRVHRLHEAHHALVALQLAARERGLTFTFDDDAVSVGSGSGSLTFPQRALPAPGEVDWERVHDVPVALITGTNGKTTTARALAAMLRASGRVTGLTSTDGVWCDDTLVDHGDYSGPVGARLVLRDPRVTAAVLETARGGMLRRGLATTRCDVAVVTRITADHMGEYGIHSLASLANAKLVVSRALVPGGTLVLNADDEELMARMGSFSHRITLFALSVRNPLVYPHVARGGTACVFREGEMLILTPEGEIALGDAADMPITLGGAAMHNIANLLAAAAAALAMGVSAEQVRATMHQFGTRPQDNPGRLALLRYRGARVVVDFVHNPDGWYAIWEALSPIFARRRLVVVGQAGDRDDNALVDMAVAVWSEEPEVVILKEMPKYRRGRPPFETRERLAQAFLGEGVKETTLRRADSEHEALQLALAEAREGDLVVLAVHDDFEKAMAQLCAAGAVVVSSLD